MHSESIRIELHEHDSLTISHSMFYPSSFMWHLLEKNVSPIIITQCYEFHLLAPNLIVKTSLPSALENMPFSKDTVPDLGTAERNHYSVPITILTPRELLARTDGVSAGDKSKAHGAIPCWQQPLPKA